jgi:6-phosphogluconolactonase
MFEIDRPIEPTPPALPGKVVVRPTREDVVDLLAGDLMGQAMACVRAFGDFHLAISASESVEPYLIRLMLDPLYRELPWKRTHLWAADECVVPAEDDRCRGKRLREFVGEHSDIPADQIHGIPVVANDPGGDYESELREAIEWREKGHDRLDFSLLTLGDPGPVSRMVAGGGVPQSDSELVLRRPWIDPAGLRWYSLSARMLGSSRFIAVSAFGDSARDAVASLAPPRGSNASPSHRPLIAPISGELRWYLDSFACPDAPRDLPFGRGDDRDGSDPGRAADPGAARLAGESSS